MKILTSTTCVVPPRYFLLRNMTVRDVHFTLLCCLGSQENQLVTCCMAAAENLTINVELHCRLEPKMKDGSGN